MENNLISDEEKEDLLKRNGKKKQVVELKCLNMMK